MKPLFFSLVSAAVGGLIVWLTLSSREPKAPAVTAAPAGHSTKAVPPAPPLTVAGSAAAPAEARPSAAEAAAQALKDEIVISYGKVEDVGRQAAVVMLAKRELYDLKSIPIAERTPEQRRRILELERQRAQVIGVLPEVAAFQNNPDEYASFFTSMIKEAAELDAGRTKAVSDYMRSRGEAMVAAGLNAAKEPADIEAQNVWEEKRDAFNIGTVNGVAALLPPGETDRIGFNEKFMELLEQDFDKAE